MMRYFVALIQGQEGSLNQTHLGEEVPLDRSREHAVMPDLIFSSARPRPVFFDRRDQLSASAIQRTRFSGSRLASCLHSTARRLNSN
jgi:hypothetical protein